MKITPKIINIEHCKWQVMREKVMMKCYQAQNITIQYACLQPGHSLAPHVHEYEQVAMILQGKCNFYIDDVAYPMSAGSIVSIPPMVKHYVQVTGSEDVINMDIFYPKRTDRKESVETVGGEGDHL